MVCNARNSSALPGSAFESLFVPTDCSVIELGVLKALMITSAKAGLTFPGATAGANVGGSGFNEVAGPEEYLDVDLLSTEDFLPLKLELVPSSPSVLVLLVPEGVCWPEADAGLAFQFDVGQF